MVSDIWPGVLLLAAAIIAFTFVVAAEAGVAAWVRAQALKEPAETRIEALRRFSQEQQVTLSSLALARNLTLIGITAIVVFLVLEETDQSWTALVLTAFATLLGVMLLQAFPRLLMSQNTKHWQLWLRPFVSFVRMAFRFPAFVLDLPMMGLLRWWRRRHPQAAIEAGKMIRLAQLEETSGVLPEEERQMIRGIMELEQTPVREVMVPRIDMAAVDMSVPFDAATSLMVDKGFSRLPIYEGTVDNIVGVAYGKDVLKCLAKDACPGNLREISRPAYFVPESKRVDEMLTEMRERRLSVAIVVDEYGGTAGLVTIEDLLEEIVGEIRDEFDIQEQEVQVITANEAIVDARVGIETLNEIFDIAIEKDDFDSVGGFIVNQLGRMPSVGDEVRVNGLALRVLSVTGRRIKKVRATKASTPPVVEHGSL